MSSQEYMVQYYKDHKATFIKRQLKRYEQDREKLLAYQNERYKLNRTELLAYQKQYAEEHPAKILQHAIRQHKKRGLRVPAFGQEDVEKFYTERPSGMVVDHIIPLCGTKVSGLHVRWNLQYLTVAENKKKGNDWDGTLENKEWENKDR